MKEYLSKLIGLLEHHKEHYVDVKIMGETRHLCARCTGEYLIGIPAFIFFSLIYTLGFSFDFNIIFIVSWLLAGLTILDWSSVEILKLREGSNTTRFITGATLGIGVSMYFWLLPSSWMFKTSTLVIYVSAMSIITFAVQCKKHDINPVIEVYKTTMNLFDIVRHPKRAMAICNCCPCCSSLCCPCCGTSAMCPCLLCCCSCGILAMICTSLSSGGLGSCNCCKGCGSCGNIGNKLKPKK